MSMANSLELRVPFLDKEVFKVASTIPTDLRVNKYNTKYAMRQAALRHLPQATAEKEKLGFPVPTRVWLKDEHYYSVVKDLFTSPTAEKFFNTEILVEYLDEHFHEKEDNSRKIWTVYVFLVWYQIYFGAVQVEDLQKQAAKPEFEEVAEAEQPFEHQPIELDPADSPFDDGEDVELNTQPQQDVSDNNDTTDGSTKVFRPVDESTAQQVAEGDDNVTIFSKTKTAKRVNLSSDAKAEDTQDNTKVKPSFKPVLEDHNDFFANLKSQLQEDIEE